MVKNKENKIISLFNSKSMFFKFIDEKIEIEGIEKINVTFKNQIEDEYNIKQQIEKKDGDKERAKEEKRKKK